MVFQRALDRLDAAMVADGEPQSALAAVATTPFSFSGGSRGIGANSRFSSQRGGGSSFPSANPSGCAVTEALPSSGTLAVARHSSRLMFEMFYLTDELLYYALKHEGFVGDVALRLANLVYLSVFRHEVMMRAYAMLGPGGGD